MQNKIGGYIVETGCSAWSTRSPPSSTFRFPQFTRYLISHAFAKEIWLHVHDD